VREFYYILTSAVSVENIVKRGRELAGELIKKARVDGCHITQYTMDNYRL